MGNNRQKVITGLDIKKQLDSYKQLLESMNPEEIEELEREKIKDEFRSREINKKIRKFEAFLFNICYDLDIFYNNFFRKRKNESFDYDELHGFRQPLSFKRQVWDDHKDQVIVHCPINKYSVSALINLAIMMELSDPLEEDTVFYRGCIGLEENGVSGIVTAATDYKTAERYSEGTILSIVVPKGTRVLNVDSFLQDEQRGEEIRKTIILPPCDYRMISKISKEKGNEPHNKKESTTHITIEVTPLDLLEEFLKVLKNPPENYALVRSIEEKWYEDAKKKIDKCCGDEDDWDRYNAGTLEDTVLYLERYLKRRDEKVKQGVRVYSKTNQVNKQINN